MTVIATTNQGWAVRRPQPSGARRPGPHATNASNPREIVFRDSAVADLHSAAMWLVHTGNGGRTRDVPVRLWHGSRPLSASFGSDRSDHKAQVAMDINWDVHLWEESTGRARYERLDINNSALRAEHATFAAVEDRLTVPGQRPVVRWCGRVWLNQRGWGYPVGYRDCMHWTIEGPPDYGRINAAVAHLHTWFVPPRTTADVIAWQKRVGATPDGSWGVASVAAMRRLQRDLNVPTTGLPGDIATWRAWKARNESRARELLTALGYRDAATYAADLDYRGRLDDTTALINHLEDTMSKIDTLISEVKALRAAVDRTPARVWSHPVPFSTNTSLRVFAPTWRAGSLLGYAANSTVTVVPEAKTEIIERLDADTEEN